MEKIKEFFKKVWQWIVNAANAIDAWVTSEGWLYLLVSALLVVAFGWIRPFWISILIVFVLGVVKEIINYFNPEKLIASWHHLICDIIGIAIGALLVGINLLAK